MADIITCTTQSGKTVQYVNEIIGSGSMKDVYFSLTEPMLLPL